MAAITLSMLAGCGRDSTSIDVQKMLDESKELGASQQARIDAASREIEALQRGQADSKRRSDSQTQKLELLERDLAAIAKQEDQQKKQMDDLQRKVAARLEAQKDAGGAATKPHDENHLPTTVAFRQKADGMTKDELVKWLGKPSDVLDNGDQKTFFYNDAARDADSEKIVHAHIIIENGVVKKVSFF